MSQTSVLELIRSDIAANRGYPKSVVVLTGYRIAHAMRSRKGIHNRVAYLGVVTTYKFLSEWLLGIEIPAATQIGPGLRLRHGIGVVINPAVVIGADVMIRQNVTLGNRRTNHDCPVIGDHVELGAGAVVIGPCQIGEGARIGAGAIVIHDVPPGGTAIASAATIREKPVAENLEPRDCTTGPAEISPAATIMIGSPYGITP
ncbi:MAG: serine acetyltransferase [Nocardioidaceae bacterium]|nr:MAG: serine acetyltransferase [Nocardioidaceae bacterium]